MEYDIRQDPWVVLLTPRGTLSYITITEALYTLDSSINPL